MAPFILSRKAKADLKEIARYTQKEWGREQRNVYLSLVYRCLGQIAAGEVATTDCSEIAAGCRKYPVGRHVIFFLHTSPNRILVIRILHHRMDIPARLKAE